MEVEETPVESPPILLQQRQGPEGHEESAGKKTQGAQLPPRPAGRVPMLSHWEARNALPINLQGKRGCGPRPWICAADGPEEEEGVDGVGSQSDELEGEGRRETLTQRDRVRCNEHNTTGAHQGSE